MKFVLCLKDLFILIELQFIIGLISHMSSDVLELLQYTVEPPSLLVKVASSLCPDFLLLHC